MKHKVFGDWEVTPEINQEMLEAYWDYIFNAKTVARGMAYVHRAIVEAACEAKILLKTKPDWKKEKPALIRWLANEITDVIEQIFEEPKN